MLAQSKSHKLQMFSWMVSKPFALLWATAEVGDLRAVKTSVQLLPSKTRAITMKINKQIVLF